MRSWLPSRPTGRRPRASQTRAAAAPVPPGEKISLIAVAEPGSQPAPLQPALLQPALRHVEVQPPTVVRRGGASWGRRARREIARGADEKRLMVG